jgi:hypothetical protein
MSFPNGRINCIKRRLGDVPELPNKCVGSEWCCATYQGLTR